MASHCFLLFLPSSFSLNPKSKRLPKPRYHPSIFSRIQTPKPDDDDKIPNNNHFDFLKLSVTLTVISTSLPKLVAAATTKVKKRLGHRVVTL